MTLLASVIAGALGLAFGSFSNVIFSRFGQPGLNLKTPSACPACGSKIRPSDNIPLLSWLLLGGRCRDCRKPISPVYPIIETTTAVLFVLAVNTENPFEAVGLEDAIARLAILTALFWLAFVGVALAAIDFKHLVLPRVYVYATFVAGLLAMAVAAFASGVQTQLVQALMGALTSWLLFWLVYRIAPKGIGLGDVRLAPVLGLYLGWFGWSALCVGWLSAFLFASIFGLIRIALKRAELRSAIAFGPWMILACFFGIFFGNTITETYLSYLHLVMG